MSKIYTTRANLHLVKNLVVQNLIITSQQFDVIRPLIIFGTVITKLPNSEQSYKGKVKTHNYINRQNQSTTGKL
jgi:hypothetical protein